jgi:hypothetical protein
MMLTTALWGVLLPAFVLWGGYTLSPLCFPMVPPTLFRDIYVEVQRLLPSFSGVPPALLRPGSQQLSPFCPLLCVDYLGVGCTTGGVRVLDDLFDASCYARCSDAPFLMTSWLAHKNTIAATFENHF